MIPAPVLEQTQGEEIQNTDKQLAEFLAEEKKLLEQQKKEQDALKQKFRAVNKQLREEEAN